MKTKLTKDVERALFDYVRESSRVNFIIGEVDVGSRWGIVDALQATIAKNVITWRCYEIKTSKSDFYSKAKVTFVGHYNYYVMPYEVYQQVKHDIPKGIGVLLYDKSIYVETKPTKMKLRVPTEHLASRFITSSHRDLYKLIEVGGSKLSRVPSSELAKELRKREDVQYAMDEAIVNEYKETIEQLRRENVKLLKRITEVK